MKDVTFLQAPKERLPGRRRPLLLMAGAIMACLLFAARPALAACGDQCSCESTAHSSQIRPLINDEHDELIEHTLAEFDDWEAFLLDPIWPDYLLPAWMLMTEQLVASAMHQIMIVGPLLDAKQQLETQTMFQRLTAEAHQDYHPNHQMCVIGTNVRSLAEAERNYEYSTFILSQRGIDRQMGNEHTAASRGEFDDHCFRLRQFRRRYCNVKDNNEHMNLICNPDPSNIAYPECMPDSVAITAETQNKDISFMRTVERANTLDIDFYSPGNGLSGDEEDVFALASNLYSHEVMFRMPEFSMRQRNSQDELLDMRSIVAKRSVAEHSFNTIVGMRAMSKEEAETLTQPYMKLILETLGLGLPTNAFPDEEIEIYLGDRPSYYAQMELLTKRIFQTPDFFVNLYDEPANVERQGVALQAIGLMQDFDTWQSYLRTEAMLSVVLELELMRLNNQVVNQMGSMRSGGFEL